MAYSGDWCTWSHQYSRCFGKLNWSAPLNGGSWTFTPSLWAGTANKRNVLPGGEGNVIDHFFIIESPASLSQSFWPAFKGHDISKLRGFFNDSYEVDDATEQSTIICLTYLMNWKKERQDLKYELPALFYHITYWKKQQNPLRLPDDDWWIDLTKQFTAHGLHGHIARKIVRNQSHGSPAEYPGPHGVVDIPETEGTEILRIKFATIQLTCYG